MNNYMNAHKAGMHKTCKSPMYEAWNDTPDRLGYISKCAEAYGNIKMGLNGFMEVRNALLEEMPDSRRLEQMKMEMQKMSLLLKEYYNILMNSAKALYPYHGADSEMQEEYTNESYLPRKKSKSLRKYQQDHLYEGFDKAAAAKLVDQRIQKYYDSISSRKRTPGKTDKTIQTEELYKLFGDLKTNKIKEVKDIARKGWNMCKDEFDLKAMKKVLSELKSCVNSLLKGRLHESFNRETAARLVNKRILKYYDNVNNRKYTRASNETDKAIEIEELYSLFSDLKTNEIEEVRNIASKGWEICENEFDLEAMEDVLGELESCVNSLTSREFLPDAEVIENPEDDFEDEFEDDEFPDEFADDNPRSRVWPEEFEDDEY